MSSVADIIPADEFNPSPEDSAWAAAIFNAEPAAPTLTTNGQPQTMAEVIDDEARSYRAWGTPVGTFLASQMERLAQLARWTGAATPAEFDDRMEVWEEEIRAREFDRGYSEGMEAARRELAIYLPR